VFRIFVSCPDRLSDRAAAVAEALAVPPELTAFVAARDLPPGRPWQVDLARELDACDALVAFLGPGFRSSQWCDQEVGHALGRRVRIVPVNAGPDRRIPHGFLGSLQALNTSGGAQQLADRIFDTLFTPDQRHRLVPAVLTALHDSRDPDRLRVWSARLVTLAGELSGENLAVIERVLASNAVLRTDRAAYADVHRVLAEA